MRSMNGSGGIAMERAAPAPQLRTSAPPFRLDCQRRQERSSQERRQHLIVSRNLKSCFLAPVASSASQLSIPSRKRSEFRPLHHALRVLPSSTAVNLICSILRVTSCGHMLCYSMSPCLHFPVRLRTLCLPLQEPLSLPFHRL